ncbi:non-structural maintenance of chromosomes element 1 homolog [Ceratina calcarata]|uniref:Non-structural maintenance of chromosomes element 1 homolog n=1 Tax=Ceratina calcarata TaxID=156304 RepID=A0AAJ7NA03_9HYME|nr:non-structural maintenance of chromosomes element 1 homolog [Ceratina calcarata]
MVYDDRHKTLLQAIIHKGLLHETRVKDLSIRLFNDDNVSKRINEINEKLLPVDMLIKKAQCEITGQVYWVFISTVLDDITKFQTEFSKEQLAFVRNIFSEIMGSETGCIESIKCLNLCSIPEVKLSTTNAEIFLEDIVDRKWLIQKDGFFYFGVRTITELMPYFRANFGNNLSVCCLCKQVVFHGKRCDNCDQLVHLYCLKRLSMVHNPIKCPNCNKVIKDMDFSGMLNDVEMEDASE